MIILISDKAFEKAYSKIAKYGEFVIVPGSSSPKMNGYHNRLSDVVTSDDGASATSSLNALAFQPALTIFDETIPGSRREELKMKFFNDPAFAEEVRVIAQLQISKPELNVFIVVDNQAYSLANEYLQQFSEILGTEMYGLCHTWDDISGMRKVFDKYAKKVLKEHKIDDINDSFDFRSFRSEDRWDGRYPTKSLNDNDDDIVIDIEDAIDEIDFAAEEANEKDKPKIYKKAVRKCFLKLVIPSEKKCKEIYHNLKLGDNDNTPFNDDADEHYRKKKHKKNKSKMRDFDLDTWEF